MFEVTVLRPASLAVTAASTPPAGACARGVVAVRDQFGRTFPGLTGRITLTAPAGFELCEQSISLDADNSGYFGFEFCCAPASSGVIEATLVESGLTAASNLVRAVPSAEPMLLWGDLHQHSTVSDGLGSPAENYAYARDVARLDFCAIADHDIWPHLFTDWEWRRICRAARECNGPGSFITFLGYEWDASRLGYGHMNVYYLEDDQPVFTSHDSRSNTPSKLFDCLSGRAATVIVHHPAATKGGWFTTDWDNFDAGLEKLVEVYSIWGSSECSREDGNTRPIGRLGGLAAHGAGCFVRDALDRGYRLGLIGGGDGHDGRPGQSLLHRLPDSQNPCSYTAGYPPYFPSGLQGVWAAACTRQAVWAAMLARRTYATTGHRPLVRFSLNGHPMGSEIDLVRTDECELRLDVAGTGELEAIEIFRNGEAFYIATAAAARQSLTVGAKCSAAATDYFYARIRQQDGNTAWTSPIWVTWG